MTEELLCQLLRSSARQGNVDGVVLVLLDSLFGLLESDHTLDGATRLRLVFAAEEVIRNLK